MRKVTITIEVELPDGYEWAAVGRSGRVHAYKAKPAISDGHFWTNLHYSEAACPVPIANWADTLTRFEEPGK